MCGMFGWVVKSRRVSRQMLASLGKSLATSNDTRGGDSWGLYGLLLHGKKPMIRRGLGDITPWGRDLCKFRVLMAHTRNATTGVISAETAHPFVNGNIIGAHNGVVYNHRELNRKYQRSFPVDSQHIFEHIRKGIPFSDLRGSGAFQWVDASKDNEAVNLCRALTGELAVAAIGTSEIKAPDSDTIGVVWSSSKKHLRAALVSANIEYYFYTVSPDTVLRAKKTALWKTENTLELSGRYDWRSCDYPRRYESNKPWLSDYQQRLLDYKDGLFADRGLREHHRRNLKTLT